MTQIDCATDLISRNGHPIARVVTTAGAWGFPSYQVVSRDRIIYGEVGSPSGLPAIAALVPPLYDQNNPDGVMLTMAKVRRDRAALSASMRKRAIERQCAEDAEAGIPRCPMLMRRLGASYGEAVIEHRKWSARVEEQAAADAGALAGCAAVMVLINSGMGVR